MIELSVIIPIFNGEKYIRRCLNSILETKDIKYEIIIVDNNSYDNTSKTVKLSTSGSTKLTVNHTITKTAGYIAAGTTAGTSKEITVSSTPAQFDFPAYDGSYSIV